MLLWQKYMLIEYRRENTPIEVTLGVREIAALVEGREFTGQAPW